jgi:hypothetical protein
MIPDSIRTGFEMHPKAYPALGDFDALKAYPFIEGDRAGVAPSDS